MEKANLIQDTVEILDKMSDKKILEVKDYASYLLKKYEEDMLQNILTQLANQSQSYQFLEDEEDLYTVEDLKIKYKWKKGKIVLVPFPFTDLKGSKIRPAIVLVNKESDIILTFISTQLNWTNKSDILVEPSSINGLKKTSVLRLSKIITLHKNLILGEIGELDAKFHKTLNDNLKYLFKLK